MKKSVLVYWLIPAKAERELFRSLIRILAKQLDAPKFEPHLTLCRAKDRQSPSKLLREIRPRSLRLAVGEIGFSSKYTKTLFVRLKPDRALDRLVGDLGYKTRLQDPHLSLLYKKLSARVTKELAATIELPFRTVVFDSIKAVRCKSPATTAADVKGWRVIATKRLNR